MTLDPGSILYAAARWLGYLAAFLLMGAAILRLVVLPRVRVPEAEIGNALRAIARLGTGAGATLVAAHLARLYGQARSLLEPGDPLTGDFLRLVLATEWGRGWTLQLGAAVLAIVGWTVARRASWERGGVALAAAAALLVAIAAPFTGHAIALPAAGRLGPALDAVHFAAGAAWLGTLAAVALLGLGTGAPLGAANARHLVAAFSPVALVSGSAVVAAGVVMAYRYLGGLAPLWTTIYGRVLVLKLIALAGVGALGAYHWRVVLPRLRQGADPGSLRRTARLELAAGAVLLAVTAVLVALPAPGEP